MSDLFKPNLAGTPKSIEEVPFPVLASAKIDGVRALRHERLMSRSMKEIPNNYIQRALAFPELRGLDGELVVGSPTDPNCMQNTTSGVMAKDKTPGFSFHVFDKFDHPAGFMDRFNEVTSIVRDIQARWANIRFANRLDGSPWLEACPIMLVEHKLIESADELLAYEADRLAEGWEGVMVRSLTGRYKQGRSTPKEGGLLKIKRFTDSEAIIIGFHEEMENTNAKVTNELGRSKRSSHKAGKVGKNTLGAFQVRDIKTGVEFSIGSGINETFAAWAWAHRDELLNQALTYKSFPIGVKDAPRHPVFKSLREKWDMSK